MEHLNFYILWAVFSLVGVWRVLCVMAINGEVNNSDRMVIFFMLTPVSLIAAPMIILFELALWGDRKIEKLKKSPRYVAWKISRQIRKRRRGPVVRVVEWMHKRRKEDHDEE